MIMKLLYIVFFMALVVGTVLFTRSIDKKIKLNRWVLGGVAPFLLIVPSIVFKEINSVIWNVLLVIFVVICIMFFELTRIRMEEKEAKSKLMLAKKKKK